MNKQEAIEKIEKGKSNFNAWEDLIRNRAFEDALTIVKKIDEPERSVVPQFVADWIEWCKKNKITLLGANTAICNNKNISSLDASGWAMKNQETFAKAWLYGYEIEKEKLYTVELPNPNSFSLIILRRNEEGKIYISFNIPNLEKWKSDENTHLTEAEIKEDFEWAWEFAEEVEE